MTGPTLHPAFGFDRGFDLYHNTMAFTDEDFTNGDPTRPTQVAHRKSHHAVTGPTVRAAVEGWLDADARPPFLLFVHLWGPDEKIYLGRNNVDPGYRPDPQSNQAVQRIAASGGGEVLGEDPGALVSRTKGFLGTGPQTSIREQRTRVSLGPYVALMALLPLGFVLLRRNV